MGCTGGKGCRNVPWFAVVEQELWDAILQSSMCSTHRALSSHSACRGYLSFWDGLCRGRALPGWWGRACSSKDHGMMCLCPGFSLGKGREGNAGGAAALGRMWLLISFP